MLVLWFIGPALEELPRALALCCSLYVVSGLAGSAGALIWSPNALTVGASGAIWGLMGAALVLEARRIYVFGGQAMGLVVVNLALTFLDPRSLDRRAHRRTDRWCSLPRSRSRACGASPALATLSVAAVGVVSVAVALAQV